MDDTARLLERAWGATRSRAAYQPSVRPAAAAGSLSSAATAWSALGEEVARRLAGRQQQGGGSVELPRFGTFVRLKAERLHGPHQGQLHDHRPALVLGQFFLRETGLRTAQPPPPPSSARRDVAQLPGRRGGAQGHGPQRLALGSIARRSGLAPDALPVLLRELVGALAQEVQQQQQQQQASGGGGSGGSRRRLCLQLPPLGHLVCERRGRVEFVFDAGFCERSSLQWPGRGVVQSRDVVRVVSSLDELLLARRPNRAVTGRSSGDGGGGGGGGSGGGGGGGGGGTVEHPRPSAALDMHQRAHRQPPPPPPPRRAEPEGPAAAAAAAAAAPLRRTAWESERGRRSRHPHRDRRHDRPEPPAVGDSQSSEEPVVGAAAPHRMMHHIDELMGMED
jgi:hypothetical protein